MRTDARDPRPPRLRAAHLLAAAVGALATVAVVAAQGIDGQSGLAAADQRIASAIAPGHDTMVLLRNMRQLRGLLVSIDERHVTIRDRAGGLVSVPASDVVAIVRERSPAEQAAARIEERFVEFIDGQRLPGRPAFGDGVLRWRHEALGTIALNPERLAHIVLDPTLPRVAPTREDVVQLLNGDRLEGIVTALGATVTLERGDGSLQDVPIERIGAVSFVNAAESHQDPSFATLWLADGSVLRSERPGLADDGILRLHPHLRPPSPDEPHRPTLLPVDALDGVLLVPDAVIPLATLVPESIEVPPPRLSRLGPVTLRPNAPIGLSDVRIRGPVTIRYALGASGLRLVAEAIVPDDALAWGDLELVILDGAEERLRQRLNRTARMISIDLVLRSDALTIRVEEGERGPVQDVVVLRAAMLGPSDG